MGRRNNFGYSPWGNVWLGFLMTTFTTEDRIIAEKDGSYTVNVNGGEITMSTRNVGMVGKAYKSASEAFKDADYATAIERPHSHDLDGIWMLFAALVFLIVFAYGFWLIIGQF